MAFFALEVAEELVGKKGRPPSAIAIIAAPDGCRALELLSPPGRPVPSEMWAALAASEQALFNDAAAGPMPGPAAARKRPREIDVSAGSNRFLPPLAACQVLLGYIVCSGPGRPRCQQQPRNRVDPGALCYCIDADYYPPLHGRAFAGSSRAETRLRTDDDRHVQHDRCEKETVESGHPKAPAARNAQRTGLDCQQYRDGVSEAPEQWSQGSQNLQQSGQQSGGEGSQRSGGEGVLGCELGCEESGCSHEAESWLGQSFPREVIPAIPPKDPYLLNVEKWPPGIKFSKVLY